ncbi:hypothetical protein KSF78_0004970 [Schistosoma japonicum]|nr:hypothetical protein KSF78_0004970 [Schistosoma japonicum]KAH8876475.1 hypothetical protein KSF78_0004970 [Schistosoma japonicum]
MLYSIVLLFIIIELSLAKEIDVFKLPFVISKKGDMIITDHDEKFSLDEKLLLTHKDLLCTTKIDFSRPNEAELKAKSGTRKLIENCKEPPKDVKHTNKKNKDASNK